MAQPPAFSYPVTINGRRFVIDSETELSPEQVQQYAGAQARQATPSATTTPHAPGSPTTAGTVMAPPPAPEPLRGSMPERIGKATLAGTADFGRHILNTPSWVGLPPVGGQDFINRSKAASDELAKGTGTAGAIAREIPGIAGTLPIRAPAAAYTMGAALPGTIRALKFGGIKAGEGALGGALTSEDPLSGAAWGAGGNLLFGGLGSRVAEPIPQSADAKWLRTLGVRPTAGQGADPTTFIGRSYGSMERGMGYLPFAGRAVSEQRGPKAQATLREAALRQTEVPGTTGPVSGNIENQILERRGQHDLAQTSAGTRAPLVRDEPRFRGELTNIAQRTPFLTPASQRAFNRDVNNFLAIPQGRQGLSLEHLMNARKELVTRASRVSGTGPEDRALRQAYTEAVNSIDSMLSRRAPAAVPHVQPLITPERNLQAIESASRRATNQGQFSGEQLGQAGLQVGSPEMANLGRTASSVMPSETVGPWRDAQTWGLGNAGLGQRLWRGFEGTVGAATLPLTGTRSGQKLLAGDTSGQRLIAAAIRNSGGVPGAATAAMFGE